MIWRLFILSLLVACSHGGRKTEKQKFDAIQAQGMNHVWVNNLGETLTLGLNDFNSRKVLPNGLVYGDIARNYHMSGKKVTQIEKDMKQAKCDKQTNVIRDTENRPVKNSHGRLIPLWSYLCKDGSVIRIKPLGDDTSRYRPEPHGSKALRYPYNGKYTSFDDELFKVDGDGNAVPKSPKDLKAKELVEGWAEDCHFYIESDIKSGDHEVFDITDGA